MSHFAHFVLCLVAVISVNAEERNEFEPVEELSMAMDDCKTKFQITDDDFETVAMTGDVLKINPCYWGCYFKKIGLLDEKGQLDLDNFKIMIRKEIKDADIITELETTGKRCASVKGKAVTDDEAVCERGALLAAGFWEILERLRVQLKDEQLSEN